MSKELQKQGKGGLKNSRIGKLDLLNINTSALSACLNDIAIPRLFYQLVIFVIDGSNSMNENSKNGVSKAQEIDNGIKLILERLKKSKNHNSFDICFLSFSEDFIDIFSVKNVKDISSNQSFNPLNYIKPKGTKLFGALMHTKEIINNYSLKNKGKNCQALIQILSDGAISDYDQSIKIINEIKK
ncbi:hypothetical protein BST83_10480 [Polaribacter filamentus]|uniref:VWFA domain-containing protein n=1 Tax=Polaribacter filamentus TaxID=53483 RepID=A0A2S7KXZ4_9FLAO|nr:vWA domain-containing protein [Polaribacter filamentus]PQB07534.1 hypothetical protein BST83_10480 [Polaribacter filamentus]